MSKATPSLQMDVSVGCWAPSSSKEMYFLCRPALKPSSSCVNPAANLNFRSALPKTIGIFCSTLPPVIGGNSGIHSSLCLPTIVGIFECLYDGNFFNFSVSSTGWLILATMIEVLAAAHPKVFGSKHTEVSPNIPIGWRGLIEEFCLLLEAICDDQELSSLQFHRILDESGCLILELDFNCELSEHQIQVIEARVFALRNRSFFSCSVCGRLTDALTTPVFCSEHEKLD